QFYLNRYLIFIFLFIWDLFSLNSDLFCFFLILGHYSASIVTSSTLFLFHGHYSLWIATLIQFFHFFGLYYITGFLHSFFQNTKKPPSSEDDFCLPGNVLLSQGRTLTTIGARA